MTVSFVVALFAHDEGAENVFGDEDEEDAGDEAVDGVEAGPGFPFEIGMLVVAGDPIDEVDYDEEGAEDEESGEDFADVFFFVEPTGGIRLGLRIVDCGLRILGFGFHGEPSVWPSLK